MNILITGGAGFIGSHLTDQLIKDGHQVRIYDALVPQVHGPGQKIPIYVNPKAEFVLGDCRDRNGLIRALKGIEIVFHQAAVVGVGQSMYEIEHYMDMNTRATATLLDILVNEPNEVKKLIVAGSMSEYGEGLYLCESCGEQEPPLRSKEQLENRDWELHCPQCQKNLSPVGTKEEKQLTAPSIYAISKKDQEEMALCIGQAYQLPVVILRYFNVYGSRQALSNPYTGVAAIFSSRILNAHAPIIYEDGQQTRDFVHVADIVQANCLAMQRDEANYQVFNVGTGQAVSIAEVAHLLAKHLKSEISPEFTDSFRQGDVRHCVADIQKIRTL